MLQRVICSLCLCNLQLKWMAGASGTLPHSHHCQPKGSCSLGLSGALLLASIYLPSLLPAEYWLFLYFKSELYYILKHERYPIQISNVLVWINRVARKVPAAKKGSYGCDSLLPAQSQDCVGKLGTHYRSVCSAAELAFTNYMCWFCK